MVLCLLLPALCASASAHSILWVTTSDHTDLVKDEEYEAAPVLMMAVPGVEVASESVECEYGGLEILYEESVPEEMEQISTADEMELPPEELEEIELEENIDDEIQEP